jgi:outer membrane lipoprotein-sorting protein
MNRTTLRRAMVPTAVVAGIAAAGAGLWPALASDGSPDLPEITAEELVVRVAGAETAQLSGTVQVDADLGLPDMGGMLNGVLSGLDGPAGQLAGLATGDSTLRVAVDGPDRQRFGVVNGSDEFTVIHNGDRLWAYDSSSNTVYEAELPESSDAAEDAPDWSGGLTPQEAAGQLLAAAGEQADISVDGTARVAGRSAYQLLVEPRDSGSGITEARISVDGETGVPLAVTVEGESGRLLDVAFSRIDYAQPPGGNFDFTPPSDAEVLRLDPNEPFGGLLDGMLPGLAG